MIQIHEYLGRKSEDKPLVVGWRKSIKVRLMAIMEEDPDREQAPEMLP
jgi:hypothetical protein